MEKAKVRIKMIRFAKVKDGWIGKVPELGIYTLENDVYAFPAGQYDCTRSYYYKGKYPTFEIHVPGRTRILWHKGVIEDHSEGCILLGVTLDVWKGKIAVLGSTSAYNTFMAYLDGVDNFILEIEEV